MSAVIRSTVFYRNRPSYLCSLMAEFGGKRTFMLMAEAAGAAARSPGARNEGSGREAVPGVSGSPRRGR
jgi:hypothetical protein